MAHVPVPGSEKAPHPEARIVGPVAPDAEATVTLVLRNATAPEAQTALLAFADAYDLRVGTEHGGYRLTGRHADLERAFQVSLHVAELPNGRQFRTRTVPGRTSDIAVPEELAPHVVAVLGLDTRPQAQPHFRRHPDLVIGPRYTAPEVGTLYQFPTDRQGRGQTVAIIELGGGYTTADCRQANVDPSHVTAIGVDGATNAPGNDADGEVALDIQVIGQLAPAAQIAVYFAPNTDQGFYDAIAAAAQSGPAAISISWGSAEQNWTSQAMTAYEQLAARTIAAGVPIFAASGDDGSSDGTADDAVDFPASAPSILGCGGTVLPSIAEEAVWNDQPNGGATGGGLSAVFPVPTYQQSLGLPHRAVPDVAGNASPETGYRVVVGGQVFQYGGTSAVAPLWAALAALLREALGRPLGDLHASLYALIGSTALHDVTRGTNGTQPATVGYDRCTGVGTPNGTALLAALQGGTDGQPAPAPTLSVVAERWYGYPTWQHDQALLPPPPAGGAYYRLLLQDSAGHSQPLGPWNWVSDAEKLHTVVPRITRKPPPEPPTGVLS